MQKYTALALLALLPACTTLSPRMQLADAINGQVNREMTYQSDQEQYGQSDRWVINPVSGKGDCEDYALTKMFKLADAKIPSHVMMCALPSGTWHSVTVLHDDGQRWVLDNIRPYPVPFDEYNCKLWFIADFNKRPIYSGK